MERPDEHQANLPFGQENRPLISPLEYDAAPMHEPEISEHGRAGAPPPPLKGIAVCNQVRDEVVDAGPIATGSKPPKVDNQHVDRASFIPPESTPPSDLITSGRAGDSPPEHSATSRSDRLEVSSDELIRGNNELYREESCRDTGQPRVSETSRNYAEQGTYISRHNQSEPGVNFKPHLRTREDAMGQAHGRKQGWTERVGINGEEQKASDHLTGRVLQARTYKTDSRINKHG